MIVTDVVRPSERAAALGRLGLSYGVGMVLGPLAGGAIAKLFRSVCVSGLHYAIEAVGTEC